MEHILIKEKLKDIFLNVFDEEVEITPNLTANDVENWDSLSHINMIVAVENEFNIKFEMSEISNLKNVGELIRLIEARA